MPRQQPGAAQPEPLVRMQQPGQCEDIQGRDDDGVVGAQALQRKHRWKVEDLLHEVLPVDVDAPPEVGKAGREKVAIVGLREVKPEQIQHPDDEVKQARNAQIEQEVRYQVL